MEEEIIVNQGPVVDSDVLNEYDTSKERTTNLNYADEIKEVINNTFNDFGVDAMVSGHIVGPNAIRFALKTGKNVSTKKISNLITDLQIRLGGVAVRLDTTSKGMHNIGLEVNNKVHELVSFKSLYESLPNIKEHPLAVPLGVKVTEEPVWVDLKEVPHILMSGTTGSGKSILMRSMITSLIMRNSIEDVQIVLFDPKHSEFNCFNDMPHLKCLIAKDKDISRRTLLELEAEVCDRLIEMDKTNCCDIDEYNEYALKNGLHKLPYIIVFIDEYADLVDQDRTAGEIVTTLVKRSKAAGVHFIVGMQNPSPKAFTGSLKAGFSCHIALMTANFIDSLSILGEGGAEKLFGRGDMLVHCHALSELGLVRLQGCFIHRNEIKTVVEELKGYYIPGHNKKKALEERELDEKTLYNKVKEWAKTKDYISIPLIQREWSIDFDCAWGYFLGLQQDGVLSDTEENDKGTKVIKK